MPGDPQPRYLQFQLVRNGDDLILSIILHHTPHHPIKLLDRKVLNAPDRAERAWWIGPLCGLEEVLDHDQQQ